MQSVSAWEGIHQWRPWPNSASCSGGGGYHEGLAHYGVTDPSGTGHADWGGIVKAPVVSIREFTIDAA
jgi:hypothetical protein